MKCQFEEKQYEQHLNNELLMRQELLYVPGQVFEGQVGFDAALYSTNRRFWKHFGPYPFSFYPWHWWQNYRHRHGITLCRDMWDNLDREISYFPKFRFNVFVQHKRPEYLTVTSSNEWSHWNRPYYRYLLTPHQQQALEHLETQAQKNAIVVYASPAFISFDELWKAIANRTLIDHSNFSQPHKLSGHHRYSYADPGNTGKAHSEAKDIESFNFYARLSEFFNIAEQADDNRTFLIRLGEQFAGIHRRLRATHRIIFHNTCCIRR